MLLAVAAALESPPPLEAPTATAVDGIADAYADAAGFVHGGIEKTDVLDEKEAQSVGQIGNRGGEEAGGEEKDKKRKAATQQRIQQQSASTT